MFVSDDMSNRVRKITSSTGIITTVAGSDILDPLYGENILATTATLSSPQSIVSDSLGNLYFVDNNNLYDFRIKKITRSTGLIATFAGGGQVRDNWDNVPATSIALTASKLVLETTSGYLYTVDNSKNHLFKISINTGNVISATPFESIHTLFLDTLGNIYYSNPFLRTVSKKSLSSGAVTTVATNVKSKGIYVDTNGILHVSLYEEGFIYKVVPNNNIATFPTLAPTALPGPTNSPTISPNFYDTDHLTYAGIKSPLGGYNRDGVLATTATLNSPSDIAFDGQGNLHIADTENFRIRKVDKITGLISTVAGTGVSGFSGDGSLATSAKLLKPTRIIFDRFGAMYFIDGLRVRGVKDGGIFPVAGDGTTTRVPIEDSMGIPDKSIGIPTDIACDLAGNIYIADVFNYVIWSIAQKRNGIRGIAFGNLASPRFNIQDVYFGYYSAITIDADGDIYIADEYLMRIVKYTRSTQTLKAYPTRFRGGSSLFVDANKNIFYSDSVRGQIRKITVSTGVTTVIAKNHYFTGGICSDVNGDIYLAGKERNAVFKVTPLAVPEIDPVVLEELDLTPDRNNKPESKTPTSRPSSGARIAIASKIVAGVDLNGGYTGYNGDGILATTAYLLGPSCVTFDSQGTMHIADTSNGRIRKVNKNTGIISTVAGTGFTTGGFKNGILATKANIYPTFMIFDVFGDIYYSDSVTLRINKITTSTGIINTAVGTGVVEYNGENIPGPSSSINLPTSLASDSQGNLYFTSTFNCRIQKLTKSTGLVNTVAGNGKNGGPSSKVGNNVRALDTPIFTKSIVIDSSGNLYFTTESDDGFIKLTMSTGLLTTIFTNNRPVYLFIDGFNNIYYSTLYDTGVIYESELYKYTATNGGSSLLSNNLNAATGFYVDATGYIYMPYSNKHVVRKVTPNNVTATPTPQPTQATAPPTRFPYNVTATPARFPSVTAPPTRFPYNVTATPTRFPSVTAPPTRPPSVTAPPTRFPSETAPPTRFPSETAPPTRPPSETAPPTRPSTNPTLRPLRSKPTRAPFKKPPRN